MTEVLELAREVGPRRVLVDPLGPGGLPRPLEDDRAPTGQRQPHHVGALPHHCCRLRTLAAHVRDGSDDALGQHFLGGVAAGSGGPGTQPGWHGPGRRRGLRSAR